MSNTSAEAQALPADFDPAPDPMELCLGLSLARLAIEPSRQLVEQFSRFVQRPLCRGQLASSLLRYR